MSGMTKSSSKIALLGIAAGTIIGLFPSATLAQYAEVIGVDPPSSGCSLAGSPQRTLRTPLIPTAPNAAPYQAPYQGQPPPVGDGPMPAPLIPGDLGAPFPPPSGMADPTHGNIFPTRTGPGEKGPGIYAAGAGRYQTQYGQQQGVFEFGQGSNGTGTVNNGGPAPDAEQSGGGGRSNGDGTVNNGGPRGDAEQSGGGGASNGDQTVNNGGPRGDAEQEGGGGASNGDQTVNDGGPRGDGEQIVNNGGPRPDAEQSGDRLFSHNKQGNRYNFNGPIPTARTFSRWLVILGVVMATVFMALAAWSFVFGAYNGASRVIGAAGGLLLLLAGYTIWKIVQMNTFHANSTGWESHHRDGSPQQLRGPGGRDPGGPVGPPTNPNSGGGGGGNPGGGGGPVGEPTNPNN